MTKDHSSYDVIVIGSGPGGYVAAIRAAQLGLRTACVERESLGGVCLNWGRIPTKALLRSAEVFELAERAAEFGVEVGEVQANFPAMIKRSRGVSKKISRGVAYLLRKNKIDHIVGTATLRGAGVVEVKNEDHARQLRTQHIIVATGARARSLPGIEIDGNDIIAYREAMTLSQKPDSLIIVGAGAIGVEFASFYASIGTDITIVEFQERLVPNEDEDISRELEKAFKKRKIRFYTGHSVTRAEATGGAVSVDIEARDGGRKLELRADKLLMAVGITGNVSNLGLEEVGVTVERGRIKCDEHFRTGVTGVYAIGDVINTPALAHTASAEGVYVAEYLAGRSPQPIPYHANPACTYCHPEIASVGLTEKQARQDGIDVRVGKFPFGPLGKTVAAGEYPGLVKLIWRASNHELVGAHMIGPAVTDLIATATLAKTTEVNAESFVNAIYAHPTFAEALKEAAEDALGHAIHL